MFAKYSRAHTVDGGNPRIIDLQRLFDQTHARKLALNARLQFRCSLLGKGNCHDLADALHGSSIRGVLRKRIGNALGKRKGFAAARTGRNHKRLIQGRDDLALARGAGIKIHESLFSQ